MRGDEAIKMPLRAGNPAGRNALQSKPSALDGTSPKPLITVVSRPDGRSALKYRVRRRGKSGLQEARCRITSGGGDPMDSATESKPPSVALAKEGKGERVR